MKVAGKRNKQLKTNLYEDNTETEKSKLDMKWMKQENTNIERQHQQQEQNRAAKDTK